MQIDLGVIMKIRNLIVVATIACVTISSAALANPDGAATGGIASGWGGATSDHVTDGLATDKSGGRNNNGGRQ